MRLVSFILFGLLVGCADKGDEGMFILNNTAPPAGTMCVFTGDPTQPFFASGEIAFDSPGGYFFSPLIESRITAVMGQEAERTIHLEGADVTLQVANGGTKQTFTALFSGSVAPNGGTTNVGFELMSKSSMNAFSNGTQNVEVVASVTPYGTLGGGRIDGEPFQYPITIQSLAGGGVEQSIGSCADPNLPAASSTGNACNQYQDGEIACCTCYHGAGGTATLTCPSAPDATNCTAKP